MLRKSCLVLLCAFSLFADKRPLGPEDYDAWRHIQNQQLSSDGRFLAYSVFPQQGDGEVVVRDLKSGKEVRECAGELPPPPPPNNANPSPEEGPPAPPGISIRFSFDSREAVFLGFASHADVERAKREKRKPADMPKGDLVVVHLETGKADRVPRVANFQLTSRNSDYIAYLQLPEKSVPDKPVPEKPAAQENGGTGGRARTVVIGDLTLRNLKNTSARKFEGVTEYLLKNDGTRVVYAVDSKMADQSGVYSVSTVEASQPVSLAKGKGTYEKLATDDNQTGVAFLSNRSEAASREPDFKVYWWDGKGSSALDVVSRQTAGFRPDWVVSERGALVVSKGGKRVFFGTSPKPRQDRRERDDTPQDEKVSMDLWSWKDDYIQPMQKVRATLERSRSYRATFDLEKKKFLQLGDPEMRDLVPNDTGTYALGSDDREYRRMQEYDERFEDTYIVNTQTGSRKLVAQKHSGRMQWAPDGQHAIYFNGKDWMLITANDCSSRNLTKDLGVSFSRAEYDMSGKPPSEGPAVWTSDGRYVLLYDQFDIWRVATSDGSAANLTRSEGRKQNVAFRFVRFEQRAGAADKGIDAAKPLLLRAENQATRDSGFYRTTIDANTGPVKLVMQAKNFAPPVKAKDADVYVTAESTFAEFPDLLVTDGTFHDLRKVTDLGSQLKPFNWGTSELIHFESTNGVPLQGTLYKPENFDPKKKYPLLVYIYERLTQGLHLFVEPKPMDSINVSLYVSNGYLVLEPDIAYKIGYPGQSALNCVLPAIQEVVDKGFVNEKAIGIQGHSWGGYQVAYMVTRTNRFRAAEAGAPVANMISAYDGVRWGPGLPRQFQYERTQSRIGGTLWDYPLRFIENSPIFMADRITTPLLMIHNDADDAVPWYQGIEFYLALRRLGKEAYMFTYNGEPHHVRRRVNQKDYAIRMKEYFDFYLKGEAKPDWMEKGIPYIERAGASLPAATPEP
jgi:dipeptidyl aminopeptidase/acylaminoacyl peptidase